MGSTLRISLLVLSALMAVSSNASAEIPLFPEEFERADIIAYLRTLSDNPAPLPEAAAEAPAAEAPADVAAEAPATEVPVAEAPAVEAPEAQAPSVEAPAAETLAARAPAEGRPPAEIPAAETAPTEAAMSPVLAMIGEMPVEDGMKVAKKCGVCHSFDEGGKNKVGPPLWGILNRAAGTADKFKYSDAMKAFGENGGSWDYATLDGYLTNPKGFIPNNKMSFSGLKKDEDRAAILAYLRTLAGEPVPLP